MFGHWSVLGPLVGSALPFSYGLFIADDWKLSVFGGIFCLAGSLGAYAYRRLIKWEDLTESELAKAKSKFEAEQNAIADKRERELDAFRRKLASDDHDRDEHLLDDLRSIADAFRSDRTWVENVPDALSSSVLARVDATFEASLANLDRSHNLRRTAKTIRGEGHQDLLKTSDELLDKVQTAVDGLGKILADVTKLSVKRLTGASLEDTDLTDNLRALRLTMDAAERAEDTRQKLISGDSDAERYREYVQ